MRLLNLVISGFILLTFLGCGGGSAPSFTFPKDGQKIDLNQPLPLGFAFQVTLDAEDYNDITIEFRMADNVRSSVLNCVNANGGPALCSKVGAGQQQGGFVGGGGGFSNCTAQSPCTIVAVAKKGDQSSFVVFYVFQ